MRLTALLFCIASVSSVAGCSTSREVAASKDRQVDAVRATVGTALIGARGKTSADQNQIDETAARLCATGAWTKPECARHGKGA